MPDAPLHPDVLAAIQAASADLAARADRYWSGAVDALLTADAPLIRVSADGTHILAATGSRGPVLRWRIQDEALDPEHGLSIVCDQTVIPADYEIAEYRYALDGTLRSMDLVSFERLFTHL